MNVLIYVLYQINIDTFSSIYENTEMFFDGRNSPNLSPGHNVVINQLLYILDRPYIKKFGQPRTIDH